MKSKVILYWFLVSLAFVLTQPGAITFANWDAPYGFYRDLSTWLGCAGAFLSFILAYGILLRWRGELGRGHVIAVATLTLVTFGLGYWAEGPIRGEMGYGTPNFLLFVAASFLGLVLSLMLLLMEIPSLILGGGIGWFYYPYDRPLMMAWLVLLAISMALLIIYLRTRRGEAKGRDSPAP